MSAEGVEARLEDELGRLEAADELTHDDLERFRQALPTDPSTARLVELWLPWPLSETFEYVSASERQSAHWRPAPPRDHPNQVRAQERFAAAAKAAEGTRGTVTIEADGDDGASSKEVPASAAITAEQLADRRDDGAADRTAGGSGERALTRLRGLLGVDGG